jgi:hypothetical protein
MPSPFPGMNPYLEQKDMWQDFHNDFLVQLRAALVRQTNAAYIVKLETRLILEEIDPPEKTLLGEADIGISLTGEGGVAIAEPERATKPQYLPLVIPEVLKVKHHYLEIQDALSRRVVTVIEMLSPSNKKSGQDRADYLAKPQSVLMRKTHFVEIDFRRAGQRPELPEIPPCDYYVLASRHEDRDRFCRYWPFGLRDPLPKILVPLSHPDPDVLIDLKEILDRTYDDAGYSRYIYGRSPEPPLSDSDAKWAREILAAAQVSSAK